MKHNKEYFDSHVIMAVEIEYEMGGRNWYTMKGTEVDSFCKSYEDSEDCISDIDFCSKQEDDWCRKVLDFAEDSWFNNRELVNRANVDNLWDFVDYVIEHELADKADSAEEKIEAEQPAKRVWTEAEIKSLIQTNDKVLYGALKNLYNQQTSDEQNDGDTRHANGVGFNAIDAPFLTSVSQFLIKKGFLTDKQKVITRRKLVKYNKQLTALANA